MKLVNYTIEVRDPILGYWDVVRTVEPHWKLTEHYVEHQFLIWKWTTVRKKYHQEKWSRDKCREIAMLWALEFSQFAPRDVRVRKTHRYQDGSQPKVTVWENGEWKDC
jgi:hypothetical protein